MFLSQCVVGKVVCDDDGGGDGGTHFPTFKCNINYTGTFSFALQTLP